MQPEEQRRGVLRRWWQRRENVALIIGTVPPLLLCLLFFVVALLFPSGPISAKLLGLLIALMLPLVGSVLIARVIRVYVHGE